MPRIHSQFQSLHVAVVFFQQAFIKYTCSFTLWLRSLVRSLARPIVFPRIDDSHCDRIHSSLTAVHCFDYGYVGKQPFAWIEYCAEYWLKELQESMDRYTGCCDITEILLNMALNTMQIIIHPLVDDNIKTLHIYSIFHSTHSLFFSITGAVAQSILKKCPKLEKTCTDSKYYPPCFLPYQTSNSSF